MGGDVIKSFLVGLGFDVDDSSMAKFRKAIDVATIKVTALATATIAMASAVAKSIASVSDDFEQMGYEYRIIAPAINKALLLRRELLKAYSAAGINIQKTVRESVLLNLSLTKTKYALDAIYKSVASKFFSLLTKQTDIFRGLIYKNMPKIISFIEKFTKAVFTAFNIVVQFGAVVFSVLSRVYDGFVKLHDATGGWSTGLLALAAIWRFLGAQLLKSPLTWVLATLGALLLLFDDFQTYQSGGKSLIDWKKLTGFTDIISDAGDILSDILTTIVAIGDGIKNLFTGNITGFLADLEAIKDAFLSINHSIDSIARVLGGSAVGKALDWRDKTESAISNFVTDTLKNPFGSSAPTPVGAGVQNSSNSNILNQQTSIQVTGSAAAQPVAYSVAAAQAQVNQSMLRNMKRFAL